MFKYLAGLYLGTAAGCALAALPFQKNKSPKQAAANFIVAAPAAWAVGSNLPEFGPSVGGVSMIATTIGAAAAIAGFEMLTRKLVKTDKATGATTSL